jgi:peptidoglycan/LPS O-acetylase OafA/YrhL
LLYIICIEHMDAYSPALDFNNPVTRVLTVCVLGLFLFLSGYLLSRRYRVATLGDAGRFYIHRFLRIYPMYLLAVPCFLLLHITTPTMALKGVVCANVISGTSPPTLWFVEVICWFYLATPLFLYCASRSVRLVLLAGSLFLCGLFLASELSHGVVDVRFAQYWPAFLTGIVVGKRRSGIQTVGRIPCVIGSAVLLSIIGWGTAQVPDRPLVLLVLRQSSTLACVPLLVAAAVASVRYVPARVVALASYCSFGAYLLHRVVFTLAVRTYKPLSVVASLLYLLCLCVPVIYALAWAFQQSSDRLSKAVRARA